MGRWREMGKRGGDRERSGQRGGKGMKKKEGKPLAEYSENLGKLRL